MTTTIVGGGAFLHIPKTGGTWVHYVLEKNGLIGDRTGHEHGWTHSEPWAFCILREPCAWFASHCAYQIKHNHPVWSGASHPWHAFNTQRGGTIDDLTNACLDAAPTLLSDNWEKYIQASKFVLRQDILAEQMIALANAVGWDLDLQSCDKTRNANVHGQLLQKTCDRIRETDPKAFEIWNNAPNLAS